MNESKGTLRCAIGFSQGLPGKLVGKAVMICYFSCPRTLIFLHMKNAAFLFACLLIVNTASSGQGIDTTKTKALAARSIGPAGMSGRVTAIDVVLSNPETIYIGTASGGLWKSTSGGTDWKPVFDDQPVASIGAVAVFQQNPDVVYVGTGEGNPRNSQSSGNGMYKSIDGGRTWTHLGLANSRNIHRVIVHPTNSDIVYAGVQGPAWGETEERGLFKSIDGGESWTKILYANPRTGIADLVVDPVNPNKIMAAMWEFRRWPWFFKSGGEGSGLFVTYDGGETWTQRTGDDGLPKGELGRIGLAIAPSQTNIVYALVEAKKNGLYKSTDGGFKWTKVSEKNIGGRPFYYGDIFVDPLNENRLYNVHTIVESSEDAGRSFETLVPYASVHPDHHAWWVHPTDPDYMIDGNDGGLAISRDRGKTWRHITNLPLSQFYHINVDMELPYNVYGGMQDNGSWRGPSQVWRAGGIRNSYWEEVAFGDGFDVVPDPSNDRYGYAMSQGGNLRRYDLETGYQKNIKPVHPDGVELRFNWNAAIATDPFDARTIYYGSQFLHKSNDRGDSWQIISPDLTTNDPEKQKQLESGGLTYDVTQAENFTTITSISPSVHDRNVIWVGTDDGNVQLTRDGGVTWTNLISRIRGVAPGSWVPQIRTSLTREGEAYVVFDDHRRNNWEPYAYRTRDFGQSWERLVDSEKVWGYALSFVQDPVQPNLLFLGTEFGLYVSVDDGKNWTKWTNGFPTVAAIDMVIHPRDHDLVVGTFGRAAYVLDDIRPLRNIAREGGQILDERLRVFEAAPAYLTVYAQASGVRFSADAEFAGENKPRGAVISYVANPPDNGAEDDVDDNDVENSDRERDAGDDESGEMDEEGSNATNAKTKDKVLVEIVNADGNIVRTISQKPEPGLNRIVWRLDEKGVRYPGTERPKPDADEPGGTSVLPGTYMARFSYAGVMDSTTIVVQVDPRLEYDDRGVRARRELLSEWNSVVEIATEAADHLSDARETIELIEKQLARRDDDAAEALKESSSSVMDSIKVLLEMVNGREVQGILRDPSTVRSMLSTARSYILSGYDDPDPSALITLRVARLSVTEFLDATNAFFDSTWHEFRQQANDANLELFKDYSPVMLN